MYVTINQDVDGKVFEVFIYNVDNNFRLFYNT